MTNTLKKAKPYTITIYNENLQRLIIALAKKQHTTTQKYIEDALKEKIATDKAQLDTEDLLSLL